MPHISSGIPVGVQSNRLLKYYYFKIFKVADSSAAVLIFTKCIPWESLISFSITFAEVYFF